MAEADLVAAEVEEEVTFLKELAAKIGVEITDLPSASVVNDYLKKGLVGQSPKRRGPKGKISDLHCRQIARALEVAINNENGKEASRQESIRIVNAVASSQEDRDFDKYKGDHLFVRLDGNFLPSDWNSSKTQTNEARRVMWTTEEKISIMFDELREVLLEYGFAFEKTEKPEQDAVELTEENLDRGHTRFCAGKLIFELDQLRRIINID